MNLEEFTRAIQGNIRVGEVWDNPKTGTSKITRISPRGISYKRRNSEIFISVEDLFDVWKHFTGQKVSSNALKAFRPSIFDSESRPAGHSCNCTFLSLLLKALGAPGEIGGQGVRGDPFYMSLPPNIEEV